MVAWALGRVTVWRCKDGLHFHLVEIGHDRFGRLLEGDASDRRGPGDMLGTVLADEPTQSVDGGQALVAGSHATIPFNLKILQEALNRRRVEVLHRQAFERFAKERAGEGEQQYQRVTIAFLCIAGEISFADEVLRQKPAHPGTEQSSILHDPSPIARTARSATMPH